MSEELMENGELRVDNGGSAWREYKLDNLCHKITDGSHHSPKNYANGFPMFSVKDMRDHGFDYSKPKVISNDDFNKLVKSGCQPFVDDILIAKDGSVMKHVFRVKKEPDYVLLSSIAILRPNKTLIDPSFFVYAIKFPEITDTILSNYVSGSGVPRIVLKDFKKVEINIPPLPEQKAISEVLSSLDDKIDLLHRQNKTLEQMAETLFRQWFVVEAGEDWGETTLGEVIDIFDSKRIPLSKMQRDKMKVGHLYPYYGAATIMDYVNDYIFDGEYVLLGEDGTVKTSEGYPVLQYATGKFWVNNHTHIMKAKAPYNNFFIWNYLSKKNIERIITGAVQPKINQTNLKSLEFPVFPIELVNKYNEVTTSLFDKINRNKKKIRTLESLRDALLPKLMSGQIRVQYDKEAE